MKTQHTPTPWTQHGRHIRLNGRLVCIIHPAHEFVGGHGETIVTACNAHDELVEALESAVRSFVTLDRLADSLSSHQEAQIAGNGCRAALAKATVATGHKGE